MVMNIFFRLFSFLSSFLGTTLIVLGLYFFLNIPLNPLIIGFIIVNLIILITRTDRGKIRNFKHIAKRKGVNRSQRNMFAKSIRNRVFSGHIARAFYLMLIIFTFKRQFFIFAIIFSSIVILTMMKLRKITIMKILTSAALGTISALIAVVISNLLI
jgi:hypothetical protein